MKCVWELTNDNIQDILHLIDNNFKETDIEKNIRDILKIPQAEKCVKISQLTKRLFLKHILQICLKQQTQMHSLWNTQLTLLTLNLSQVKSIL